MTKKNQANAIEPGNTVVDASGERAIVMGVDRSGTEHFVTLQLDDASQLALPSSLLKTTADGLRFDMRFHGLSGAAPDEFVIPLSEESLQVDKRIVDTGRGVRISKRVAEIPQQIEVPLIKDELEIRRVPCDRLLPEGTVLHTREEGDTLIFPVVEEVLVVQKRLRLKEELHITRRKVETREAQSVVLRKEELQVERFDEHR